MAADGSTVKVHYTGTLDDGTVFDSSKEREPLEFTLGEGKVIPGFEAAVKDMEVGQSKTVTIPADEAYGPHRDDLLVPVEKGQHKPGHADDGPQDKPEPDIGPEGQRISLNTYKELDSVAPGSVVMCAFMHHVRASPLQLPTFRRTSGSGSSVRHGFLPR